MKTHGPGMFFILVTIISILGLFLGGTNGALGIAETARGARAVVSGTMPGGIILEGEGLITLIWPYFDHYAFVTFSQAGNPARELSTFRNATTANYLEIQDFINYLMQHGYKTTTPDQLPSGLVQSIRGPLMYILAFGGSVVFRTAWFFPVVLVYQPSGWLSPEVDL